VQLFLDYNLQVFIVRLFLTNFTAIRHESQVCYHSATQSSQFDVSFPEKIPKIVATEGEILSLKFTKYRLAITEKRCKFDLSQFSD